MKQDVTAILIGYGSIGRRHAKTLAGLRSDLIIVDGSQNARDQASKDHPGSKVAGNLDELDGRVKDWKSTVAVIASWGPSHSSLFNELADRGVRRILCEKPMADSIASAHQMASRAAREGIVLAVHHYVRYARLVSALARAAADYDLGNPVKVIVEGGAACLATNGVHWIDFARELFGARPEFVISTARADNINPRSADLGFFEGTAVWGFSGGREAVISFTNLSSIALTTRVFYLNALVEMDADLNLSIRRRDMAAVEQFPKVTRTGPALQCLFEGQLPGVVQFEDRLRAAVLDVSGAAAETCPGSIGVDAVEYCIGAFVSARQRSAVEFPLDREGPLAEERWPIS